MSIFNAAQIKCPGCGHEQEVQLVASVNADRRKDLREAILQRSFQAHECPACGAAMRLPLHMTYIDMRRGLWLLAAAADEIDEWVPQVEQARALFEDSFGEDAPPPARALAAGISPRIVFGWPALREKIIANQLGLDDVVVELIKAALLRARPDAALEPQQAFRLAGGTDEILAFEICDDITERIIANLEVPHSLYTDIAGDAAWTPLRELIASEPFVDLKRLMIIGDPAEAEEALA